MLNTCHKAVFQIFLLGIKELCPALVGDAVIYRLQNQYSIYECGVSHERSYILSVTGIHAYAICLVQGVMQDYILPLECSEGDKTEEGSVGIAT